MDLIKKYFPDSSHQQLAQFRELDALLREWNEKINLVSRKDMPFLVERHILHSLSIAKLIKFRPDTKILDVGTGGGFPGLPLAILFPETEFTLSDSIGKKIMVVRDLAEKLRLKNVHPVNERAEKLNSRFHFVVSRAVTSLPEFFQWVSGQFCRENFNPLQNGILYLKGGDFEEELIPFRRRVKIFSIRDYFEEEYFQTKKIIYLRVS